MIFKYAKISEKKRKVKVNVFSHLEHLIEIEDAINLVKDSEDEIILNFFDKSFIR